MKKSLAFIVSLLSGIAIFFLLRFLIVDVDEIWNLLMAIFGKYQSILETPIVIIVFLTFCSLMFMILIFQLLLKKVFVYYTYVMSAIYLLSVFSVIMLKSRGIRGINIDLLSVVEQFVESPITVLMNLILFIPIGTVAYLFSRSTVKSVLCALIFILACEISQYIFALGIFDIVDIVLNTYGFILGCLVAEYTVSKGIKIKRDGAYFLLEFKSDDG